MNYLKNHMKLALSYFLIAAVLGLVLRSFHSIEIPGQLQIYRPYPLTHCPIGLGPCGLDDLDL